MLKNFKHFVIVKFNYPEGYKGLSIAKHMLKWVCLDSLRCQTVKDFTLVMISDMPLSSEGFGEFIISLDWKRKVREIAAAYDWCVTTRLDADDFVTDDFIATVQKAAVPKHALAMQTDGWIYDAREDALLDNYMFRKFSTSHISLVEKVPDIATIYAEPHTRIKKLHEMKWIDRKCTVRCINEGSIKGAERKVGHFSKHGVPADRTKLGAAFNKRLERSRNLNAKLGRLKTMGENVKGEAKQ